MARTGKRGGLPRMVGIAVVTLCSGLAVRYTSAQQPPPRPTPAPTQFSGEADAAPRPAVLQYAATLDWNSWDGARGDQRLHIMGAGGQWTLGPRASIEPEIGSAALDPNNMGGKGRIIARITSAADYDKLGIKTGLNYVWVDQAGTRAAMIPANPQARSTPLKLTHIDPHPPNTYPASARWLWSDTDEIAWMTCPWGCCRIQS